MWRLADIHDPSIIPPSDKTAISSEYRCLFGISNPVKGMKLGSTENVFRPGSSTMVICSKDYRLYWFYFEKYPKKLAWNEIPRYSSQDAEDFAASNADAFILPRGEVKFSDIWKAKTSAALVALEEAEFKTWTWGRIACIGDGIHKMTPNFGQGGNAAIESATTVANNLHLLLKSVPLGQKPALEQVTACLKAYQAKRMIRMATIQKTAAVVTRLHALDSFFHRFAVRFIIPRAGDYLADMLCDT
jgi:2-polyprenyl-6-methoxyphenol hydroxylase-like FAD-dependent oxidoreductase